MSLQTAFAKGKTALKRGAFGAALLLAANAAQAGEFNENECTKIAGVATDVVTFMGQENLSQAFVGSFGNFLFSSDDKMDCGGPMVIQAPTSKDVTAYNSIRLIVGSGQNPIDLQKRGMRAVTSVAVSSTDAPTLR